MGEDKAGTPLHTAAGVGAKWAVGALLSAGADRNVSNARGQFPLDCIGLSPSGAVTNLSTDAVRAKNYPYMTFPTDAVDFSTATPCGDEDEMDVDSG